MSLSHMRSNGRLDWIEAGRGLAAIAVVCSHIPPVAHAVWAAPIGLGAMGVEFFFLLSGFIILHIHAREVGRADALPRYAWRRAGRIFSTYWLVFLIILALDQTLLSPTMRAKVDGWFMLREIFLLPGGSPFIGPAWTLRHELLFYALFATLIIDRRLGLAMIGFWTIAIVAALPLIGLGMTPTHSMAEIALHHYNLDFMLGMSMAIAAARGRERLLTTGAAVVAILLLGAWVAAGAPVDSATHIFGYKALFLAVLGGAIILARGAIRAPRLAILLGAASYSIYLLNRDAGHFMARVWRGLGHENWTDTWPAFFFTVTTAAVAGIIFHLAYEKPVLRWINSRPWARHGNSR